MLKRGPKPKGKVKIEWSPDFAYAIGLLVTDGCVYRDGRHINMTSKDLEQIANFKKALNIDNSITMKARADEQIKKYYVVQFGDANFVQFLASIGILPAKSKILERINVPGVYFFDFLRGVFDGDGYVHSYFDPRWRSSFLWYIGFCSASPKFLNWIRSELHDRLGIIGHITKSEGNSCQQLKYAKREAIRIVKKLYENNKAMCLSRKKLKIEKILAIVDILNGKRG
jgi:hypothetical protein